ncbi:HAD superfamily hydrolase (TIGR01509 family) [Enterococcus sp. PF1-24]|uniref:HAD family hydrolase n=1 Tax=unclassified Enterococcus TaxID=2608891 RepID=UPI002473B128|nr:MULTISPECIES: HAD family hydrolase [unclassified Enterococcus]MDH6363557.1 HAD superfamily hydrolase (TIGR01509 family) [Enterococcus sp. PFB1-1]MDH6400792.1 HAD superfamily hydrolase (TIGR01509 family) [Enterococcus sp. PF1-24]
MTEKKQHLAAIIFDMDGVLVDSEYTYLESKTAMLKDAGFTKDISYQYQFMGTTHEFMWQVMKDELGLPLTVAEYIAEMNKQRQLMIERDGVKAIKHAQALVQRLAATGIPLAVASSSPKKEILAMLQALEIKDCFDVIVSGEEVSHSKPEPDIFLKAAADLGVAARDCLVFEDTKNGSLAGKRAEMYVVGFANPDYPLQDLSCANQVINSFAEIDLPQLQKWVAEV